MRISRQCTKEGMMVWIWNMFVDHFHSKRYILAIFIKFHVMKFKVEDIPLTTID